MSTSDTLFAGSIPAMYDRYMVPLLFRPYAEQTAQRAQALSPMHILETAAGTGVVTEALHGALPTAEIKATDLNPPMLQEAARRVTSPNVRFEQADALDLPFGDGSFDLVVCQFGAMFFPDKVKGHAEARRVLRPSGRLYVAEPLARGPHQYIIELFHDETAVRKGAAEALAKFARPQFATDQIATYAEKRSYSDFDSFAARMIANMRFNGYTEEAVLAPAVRRRFEETRAAHGGRFDQPVRIDCFGPAA